MKPFHVVHYGGGHVSGRTHWLMVRLSYICTAFPDKKVLYATENWQRARDIFNKEFPHLLCRYVPGGVEIRGPRCKL